MKVKWPTLKRKKPEVESTKIIDKHEDATVLHKNLYKWYRDSKIIGLIGLALAIAMQIFAFLEVPFFSTVHAYTIGMVMGYYNPFFYLLMIFICLRLIWGPKLVMPRWFRIRPLEWIVLSVCVLYIAVATGFYQTSESWVHVGTSSWNATDKWYTTFTNSGDTAKWYIPASTNGGAFGVVVYSFVSMAISGIGALLLGVFLVTLVFSILLTGTVFGGYRFIINKIRKAQGKPPLKRRVKAPRYAPSLTPASKKVALPQLQLTTDTPVAELKPKNLLETRKPESAPEKSKLQDDEELPFEDPFE